MEIYQKLGLAVITYANNTKSVFTGAISAKACKKLLMFEKVK